MVPAHSVYMRSVLLVEDNDDHAELMRRAFARHAPEHELVRLEDGEQAVEYLLGNRPDGRRMPALVLLDLRLPRLTGVEVLRRLAKSPRGRAAPVVVLTTSEARTDMAAAYAHGASAYLVKPSDFSSFDTMLRDISRFWLAHNMPPPPELWGSA